MGQSKSLTPGTCTDEPMSAIRSVLIVDPSSKIPQTCCGLGEKLSLFIQRCITRHIDLSNRIQPGDLKVHRTLRDLNRELIPKLLEESLGAICQAALDHLNGVLQERAARGQLLEKALGEIQKFLEVLEKINRQCAEKGWRNPTAMHIVELLNETDYTHRACAGGESSSSAHLEDQADRLLNSFFPKCERAINQNNSSLLAFANHLLCKSAGKGYFQENIRNLCLKGLTELTEQLASPQFWTDSLNDGLEQLSARLQNLHEKNLEFPPLPRVCQAKLSDDPLSRRLAQKVAQTSSAFFSYIPLFHKLQSFLDRLFHPAMAVGQRWSENLLTRSTVESLHRFLDTPMPMWSECVIAHLETTLQSKRDERDRSKTIKAQVLATARKIMLTVISYPLYSMNYLAGRFVDLNKKLEASIAHSGGLLRFLRPAISLGCKVRNLAARVAEYLWHSKPVFAARHLANTLWIRLVNCLISPFGFVVASHVDERFAELSKSPVKQVFVHRMLDLLMEELQLNGQYGLRSSFESGRAFQNQNLMQRDHRAHIFPELA